MKFPSLYPKPVQSWFRIIHASGLSVTKTRCAKLWKGGSKKATEENDVDSKTNKTTTKHENELP